MAPDEAQEYDARLRWWRVHCVAAVSLVPLSVGAAILEHGAAMLPIGLVIALGAHAGVKAGRTLLPRDRGVLSDSEPAEFPDGDALDGSTSASLIILMFVGLGLAAYGVYTLARWLLAPLA